MALRYALRGFGTQLRNANWLTVRAIVNNAETIDANQALIDGKANKKREQLVNLLMKYNFEEEQIERVLSGIGRHLNDEKLTINAIRDTIECWLSSIRPKRLSEKQLDRFSAEDIDYDLAADFQTIVSSVEPELLLMNDEAITRRIDDIRSLDIIGSSRDLWRIFVYAPRAYYMQHWNDILKKYYYLNFRVLDWLIDKKDKFNLHPHPIIRNAKVMELSFDTIRCRFLFAQKTGLKSPSIVTELSDAKLIEKVDLRMLMLTPIDQYLNAVAPHCTEEEYLVYKKMITEREIDNEEAEEEELINEMIEMGQLKYSPAPKRQPEEDKTKFIFIKEPIKPLKFDK